MRTGWKNIKTLNTLCVSFEESSFEESSFEESKITLICFKNNLQFGSNFSSSLLDEKLETASRKFLFKYYILCAIQSSGGDNFAEVGGLD